MAASMRTSVCLTCLCVDRVSLNLAKNGFSVNDVANIVGALRSMACLERLCLSENVKRGIGKKTDKEGVIGAALLDLFEHVPTLNELAITGSEAMSCYLDVGLLPFLEHLVCFGVMSLFTLKYKPCSML